MDLYFDQYTKAANPDEAREFRILSKQAERIEVSAANEFEIITRWGFILWMANMAHTYVLSPDPAPGTGFNPKKAFDLFYNPNLKQPQLRFSIALD